METCLEIYLLCSLNPHSLLPGGKMCSSLQDLRGEERACGTEVQVEAIDQGVFITASF